MALPPPYKSDHMKHDMVEQHCHTVQFVDHLLEVKRRNIHASFCRRMNTAIAQLSPGFNVSRFHLSKGADAQPTETSSSFTSTRIAISE
jgi:hypothetical protein